VSYAADGPTDSIALNFRPVDARSWLPRFAGLTGFLAAVGLAVMLLRTGLLWNWFARWPFVFGVILGLTWWLWASPSAAGLIIVLIALLVQFFPWRRLARSASVARLG